MSKPCQHAASGCDYPTGECIGECKTAQPTDPAPAGWKLVPVEPTRDMLTVWIKTPVVSNATASALYRAMLTAAPQPPVVGSSLTAQDIADSALLSNIESPLNACMHQEHCKRWKAHAAQPTVVEQEPYCFASLNKQGDVTSVAKRRDGWRKTPLYLHPQTPRQPLTDSYILGLWQHTSQPDAHRIERFARAIERAHGIVGEE